MFDETSFSLDAFAQESWLFLLDVPYFDLTGKQRVYVRSVVESVYSISEANEIVSFASGNNLSVLDSAIALRVSTKPLQLVIEAAAKKQASNKLLTAREPKVRAMPAIRPAYAVSSATAINAVHESLSVVSWHAVDSIVASDSVDQVFVSAGRN